MNRSQQIYVNKDAYDVNQNAHELHDHLGKLKEQHEKETGELETLHGLHKNEQKHLPARKKMFEGRIVRKSIHLEARYFETPEQADDRRAIVEKLIEEFEDERDNAEAGARMEIGNFEHKLEEWQDKSFPKMDTLEKSIVEIEKEIADLENKFAKFHPLVS